MFCPRTNGVVIVDYASQFRVLIVLLLVTYGLPSLMHQRVELVQMTSASFIEFRGAVERTTN
jgi:hypothetical protein